MIFIKKIYIFCFILSVGLFFLLPKISEAESCQVTSAEFTPFGVQEEIPAIVTVKIIFTEGCLGKELSIFIKGQYSGDSIDVLEESVFTPSEVNTELSFKPGDEEGNVGLAFYWLDIITPDSEYDTFNDVYSKLLSKDTETDPDKKLPSHAVGNLAFVNHYETLKTSASLIDPFSQRRFISYECSGTCTSDWELLSTKGLIKAASPDCKLTAATFSPSGDQSSWFKDTEPHVTTSLTIKSESCIDQIAYLTIAHFYQESTVTEGVLAKVVPVKNITNYAFAITNNGTTINLRAGEDACSLSNTTCLFGYKISLKPLNSFGGETHTFGAPVYSSAISIPAGSFTPFFFNLTIDDLQSTISYPCDKNTAAGETDQTICSYSAETNEQYGWRVTGLVGAKEYLPGVGINPVPGALPPGAYTGEYKLIEPIPGVGASIDTTAGLGDYLNRIITLIIMIAGVLSVLMLVIGGIEYALPEVSFAGAGGQSKSEAKKRMGNALFGLVLALGSYMILNTINPNLVNIGLVINPVELEFTEATVNPDGSVNWSQCPSKKEPAGYNNGAGSCTNCTPLDSSISIKTGSNNTIASDMATKLKGLKTETDKFSPPLTGPTINWQITEAFPPKNTKHCDPRHYNGNTVDVSFVGTTYNSQNITAFIAKAEDANLIAEFETADKNRATNLDKEVKELRKSKSKTGDVLFVGHATGEHFSVYNK